METAHGRGLSGHVHVVDSWCILSLILPVIWELSSGNLALDIVSGSSTGRNYDTLKHNTLTDTTAFCYERRSSQAKITVGVFCILYGR